MMQLAEDDVVVCTQSPAELSVRRIRSADRILRMASPAAMTAPPSCVYFNLLTSDDRRDIPQESKRTGGGIPAGYDDVVSRGVSKR
jgi:hypothetical protein